MIFGFSDVKMQWTFVPSGIYSFLFVYCTDKQIWNIDKVKMYTRCDELCELVLSVQLHLKLSFILQDSLIIWKVMLVRL